MKFKDDSDARAAANDRDQAILSFITVIHRRLLEVVDLATDPVNAGPFARATVNSILDKAPAQAAY